MTQRKLDNWLERYIQFTQNSEPPTIYHLWSGIMALSSCLQRKCYMNWGHAMTIYPNLYTVLVGPPGGRKGTAMKIAKGFLQHIDISLGSDSLGSIQALYEEILNSSQEYYHEGLTYEHKSLSVWSEEFQVFLSDSDPRLIGNITDLFDSPAHWSYTSIGRGNKDLSNCWLNIFGAITPSLLQSKLNQDAVGGGLISRIIFVVGYGKHKKVPITFLSKEEENLRDDLMADLEYIKNLTGPFTAEAPFIDAYSEWYLSPRSNKGVDSEKFVGYNERRALHLRKLCMIMCVAEDDSMNLKERHFWRALKVLEMTEREMPNAFYGLGNGQHSTTLTNIMTFMRERGTATWVEILRRFQLDVLPPELETYMSMLQQTQKVSVETKQGVGRTFTYNQDNATGIDDADQPPDDDGLYKHRL